MDDNEKRILNWKRKLIEIFRRQFDNAEREGFSFLSYDCIGNKLGPVLPSDLINFLEVLKRLEDEQCIAINENQMLCEAFLIMNNEKADKAFRHLSVKKRDFKKELKEHGERHISSYRESLYKIGKYIQNLEEVGIEHLEHIFREQWNDNIKSVIQFLHHLHFSKIIAPQDNTVLFNGLRRISPIDINVVNSFLFPADKEIFRSLHDDVDDPTHNRKISIQTQDNESENESLSGETEVSEKGAYGANDPGVFDPEKLLHSSDDEKSMIPDLDKLTGGEDPAEEKGEKLEELPEEKSEKSKEGGTKPVRET